MSVCAQTSTCDGCGQFETAHVSLCQCPPLQRLARQVEVLRMRLDVQSQTIGSLMERIDGLSRRLMRAEQALLDQREDLDGRTQRLSEAFADLAAALEALERSSTPQAYL